MILQHLCGLSLKKPSVRSKQVEIYKKKTFSFINVNLNADILFFTGYTQSQIYPYKKKKQVMQEYIDFVTNNPMLAGAWVVIAAMLIHSVVKAKLSKTNNINPQEATLLINKQDAIVVDVRSAEEFKKGHIVNAKNVTVSQIDEGKFAAIENNKKTPIIVVCATGTRSGGAGDKLAKAGFEQVNNLFSGMSGWSAANLPTTKK